MDIFLGILFLVGALACGGFGYMLFTIERTTEAIGTKIGIFGGMALLLLLLLYLFSIAMSFFRAARKKRIDKMIEARRPKKKDDNA